MKEQVFNYNNTFDLENGAQLPSLELKYATYGRLNSDGSNVIWVCHALTANSRVDEWWGGLVGYSCLFNPDEYFIVCANALGSCYGSTGPASENPLTGEPYYTDFPQITIRDIVNAFDLLRRHLGISRVYACIGGSMGGQQALEWSIAKPYLFEHLILIATNAFHSPWGIAFNETQRMAIKTDPSWNKRSLDAGQEGLKAARAIGMLSYRNYDTYSNTQHEDNEDKTDDFKAARYQHYQGQKLVQRFNTHAYLTLSKAMDSHNVARGRGSAAKALAQVRAATLVIGITTDILFPCSEQMYLARYINKARYREIDSLYGHDGFLIETDKISELIEEFLKKEKVEIWR